MKLLKIIPLSLALMLAACGTTTPSSSSQPVTPSSNEEESSELDLYGFELKKTQEIVTADSYNLADQITLKGNTQLSDLSFNILNQEIATVSAAGLISKVSYGSTQVGVSRKTFPLLDKIFTIYFFPTADAHLGKFSAELTADPSHEENTITVTIETKQDNKFSIKYTAGYAKVGTEEPTIIHIENPVEAEGVFELEGALKFTVTTEAFPFRKMFGGRLVFDGNNPIIDTKVPVSESKTSDRTSLIKSVPNA